MINLHWMLLEFYFHLIFLGRNAQGAPLGDFCIPLSLTQVINWHLEVKAQLNLLALHTSARLCLSDASNLQDAFIIVCVCEIQYVTECTHSSACTYGRGRPAVGRKTDHLPFLCSQCSASKPITGVRKHISCRRWGRLTGGGAKRIKR